MNLSFYIARRYIIAKKSHNAINIISAISVLGVFIGAMALIVVLSVFNGFENLVVSLYNSFDPDIKITPATGKMFDPDAAPFQKLKEIKGIRNAGKTLEENVLIKYRDKQYIATIKGVENSFPQMSGIDTMISEGDFALQKDSEYYAVVGQGVAYNLALSLGDMINPLTFYVPKPGKEAVINPEDAFSVSGIYPAGVFSIQQDFDNKYVLVPIDFARELLGQNRKVSSLEITLDPDADQASIKKQIQSLLGNNFEVKNRYEQHIFLYRIMKSEKWAVFLILAFILIVATFNIVGSITMLVVDKKQDIIILKNLGADTDLIRKIFIAEGLMISLSGAILGLIAGAGICWLQETFGLVKLGGEGTFVVSHYPVKMMAADFIYVFLTVITIGFVAAWYPVRVLMKGYGSE